MLPTQPFLDDRRLETVAAKVLAGERLGLDDGVELYRSPDILGIGWLANQVRERKSGSR